MRRRTIYAGAEVRNFARMFVTEGENISWTDANKTGFIIAVRDGEFSVYKKFGRDMYTQEINTAFGKFLQEYEAEFGEKIAVGKRTCRYRFCYHEGMSGAQDTYIEYDDGDGFPRRKHITHMSCFGKSDGLRCYFYDFADLCVTERFLKIEDGCYIYDEENDANSEQEFKIIKPRLLWYEEGWVSPYERPTEVVPLKVCREVPAEDMNDDDGDNDDCNADDIAEDIDDDDTTDVDA